MAEWALWLSLLAVLLACHVVGLRYFAAAFGLKTLTLAHSAVAALLLALLAAGLIALGISLGPRASVPWYATAAIAALAISLGGLALLRIVLRLSWMQAARAALLLVASSGLAACIGAIPLKLFHPTYVIPTNAMAPTIKGRHLVGVCPRCGQSTVVSFVELDGPRGGRRVNDEGICTSCLQVSLQLGEPIDVAGQVHIGDRIWVRGLATPRRWDVVVFRFPGDRKMIYVKRLVGLPGESIEVKEGGIYINGARLTPPPEIADLKWFLPEDQLFATAYAAPGNPTRLAAGECFVLGDFSPKSSDSRFWGPVPQNDILGVVGGVYFPPRAWKVLPRH